MTAWATRRRTLYFLIASGGALAALGFFLWPVFAPKPPTCADGEQNQDERGVDCGGACAALCREDIAVPTVLWARAFSVAPGLVSAAALIENANANAAADEAPYLLRVYDAANLLIAERRGIVSLAPRSVTAVFEGGIAVGERAPARTFLEVDTGRAAWRRGVPEAAVVGVENKVVSADAPAPRVSAELANRTLAPLGRVEAVVVIFDGRDNAMAASKTFVDAIPKNGRASVAFTWSAPFPEAPVRVEIYPRVVAR
jgi:hypothetical protein